MLATDAKKLRWCGVDMRSRSRRRVAVVLTYAVFLAVVWLHPWRIDQMPWALFIGINLPMWERTMKDSIGTIARDSAGCDVSGYGVALLEVSREARQDDL